MQGEKQHYVPQFLLKNFTHGKKPKIFVYDKSNDRCFQTNIKNIAVENEFYDIRFEDYILTMEPALSRLETNTSSIVKKILRHRSLQSLTENQIETLALFVAVQFVRTKEHRLVFKHIGEQLADSLSKTGTSKEQIKRMIGEPPGESSRKLFGMSAFMNVKEYIPHLLNKAWLLFETTPKYPFFISDNPIVLHNDQDHGPYGNLGLAVRGIQVYIPLSSTLCLNLLCPTIANEFRKWFTNLQVLDQIDTGQADTDIKKPSFGRTFCEGLINGTPIQIIEDNVTMINSLQVVFSSRFVYCGSNKFDLIRRMIGDNQSFREGLKPTIG